ncbi:hypothetical protein NQD34_007744 [Periophthalmus magnuspinnatus]|nr:hypothetical protein NQD34_007744 [Periophthalmus magnuspinnatus]
MVKIAFNAALAQKGLGKEVPSAVKDPELAGPLPPSEGSTGRCLLTLLGIAFILSGLIVGGACLYRYFTPKRLYHGSMQFNDGSSGGEAQPYYLPQVEEKMEISDNMAVISVPPPRFRPGDPAYILHDFNRSGSYRSYLVQEDLVVTERIEDIKPLGFYIRRLCDGKETYRMQRRDTVQGGGIVKRAAPRTASPSGILRTDPLPYATYSTYSGLEVVKRVPCLLIQDFR